MTEDHDKIIKLEQRVHVLECTVRKYDKALWGLLLTVFGVIGSVAVYAFTSIFTINR